jgi:hypothetical protein
MTALAATEPLAAPPPAGLTGHRTAAAVRAALAELRADMTGCPLDEILDRLDTDLPAAVTAHLTGPTVVPARIPQAVDLTDLAVILTAAIHKAASRDRSVRAELRLLDCGGALAAVAREELPRLDRFRAACRVVLPDHVRAALHAATAP